MTVLCDVYDRHLRGVPTHILATGGCAHKCLLASRKYTAAPCLEFDAQFGTGICARNCTAAL